MRNQQNVLLNGKITIEQKPGETVIIYKQILRNRKTLNLTHGARFLHCLLRSLENIKGWSITVKGLSTEMGVSKPTLIKFLNELRNSELIETVPTKDEETKRHTGYLWIIYPICKKEYERRMSEIS